LELPLDRREAREQRIPSGRATRLAALPEERCSCSTSLWLLGAELILTLVARVATPHLEPAASSRTLSSVNCRLYSDDRLPMPDELGPDGRNARCVPALSVSAMKRSIAVTRASMPKSSTRASDLSLEAAVSDEHLVVEIRESDSVIGKLSNTRSIARRSGGFGRALLLPPGLALLEAHQRLPDTGNPVPQRRAALCAASGGPEHATRFGWLTAASDARRATWFRERACAPG